MARSTSTRTAVLVDGEMSEDFEVTVGVNQGCILSPLLFIAVMQYVTESARIKDIMELLYADDIALWDEAIEEVLVKHHD